MKGIKFKPNHNVIKGILLVFVLLCYSNISAQISFTIGYLNYRITSDSTVSVVGDGIFTGELIIPYVTPCVECYASHFKKVLKDWKPKKHPVVRRYDEIGGLSSMSLFSSSYACIEIVKYLAGLVPMTDSYKIRGEFLFHDMSLTYLNVKKNPDCPICGGKTFNES